MLLTWSWLLRVFSSTFSSNNWKYKKGDYRIYPKTFYRVDYGSSTWFWENCGVNPNERFHMQDCGLWHIDSKRLCESSIKRASSIKLQNLAAMTSSEQKCWHEEKVDAKKLTEILWYVRYEDLSEKVILLRDVIFNWVAVCITVRITSKSWN